MDDYVIEEGKEITTDAGTFRALVVADPEGFNPRTNYDHHAGTIVADFRGYTLPQEDRPGLHHNTVLAAIEDHPFRVVARWLRLFHGASVVLPLYNAGGNGGPRLSPGSGAEDEDASPGNYIGVTFDSADRWAELGLTYDSPEAREKRLPTITRDDVVESLRAEVLQYNTWAHGEMLGWRVDRTANAGDDEVWETVESAGGYFTVEDARADGTEELETIAAEAQAAHVNELHAVALAEHKAWQRAAVVARLRPLVAEYQRAQAELVNHPRYEDGTPPDDLYYSRDDAGVAVAECVPELLALLDD